MHDLHQVVFAQSLKFNYAIFETTVLNDRVISIRPFREFQEPLGTTFEAESDAIPYGPLWHSDATSVPPLPFE